METDRWLTVPEVADYLSLHPDTVRAFLRQGRLTGHLISRKGGWRVRQSEADRFVTSGTHDKGGSDAAEPIPPLVTKP